MSWWFYRKDKNDKRQLWGVNIDPLIPMLVMGFLFAAVLPGIRRDPTGFVTTLVGIGGLIALCGFACLLLSKMSLFRRGIWISYGTRQMSERNALIYRMGYVLIIVGGFSFWLFSRLLA